MKPQVEQQKADRRGELMLEGIIDILIFILNLTHKVTLTWVVDIILLTIIVRVLMYPLNRTMNRSMKMMQKLQPEMKEIQDKNKDKPDVAQREIMDLYRKYKVNPLSSCWPILVQMPIFVALFWALRDPRYYLRLPDFGHATIFGTQLTIPPFLSHPFPEIALKTGVFDIHGLFAMPMLADRFLYLPTFWLVALYIATTIVQSRQMQAQSQSASSGQTNQMALMLPMFIIFGLLFPTGLLVYFIVSNLLQMGQYWQIQREIVHEDNLREEVNSKDPDNGALSNKTAALFKGAGPKKSNKDLPSGPRKKK
jgi:YidC/Oxa1 family membrane protein insertase